MQNGWQKVCSNLDMTYAVYNLIEGRYKSLFVCCYKVLRVLDGPILRLMR